MPKERCKKPLQIRLYVESANVSLHKIYECRTFHFKLLLFFKFLRMLSLLFVDVSMIEIK